MRYRKTTDEELALILEEGEGYTLAFKQSINSDLPKELVALANASGGRIFIGINDLNQVVGVDLTYKNGSTGRAFLWQDGQMQDLNGSFQSPDGQKWNLRGAGDISNAGKIIGGAQTGGKRNQVSHGFVMTPLP